MIGFVTGCLVRYFFLKIDKRVVSCEERCFGFLSVLVRMWGGCVGFRSSCYLEKRILRGFLGFYIF